MYIVSYYDYASLVTFIILQSLQFTFLEFSYTLFKLVQVSLVQFYLYAGRRFRLVQFYLQFRFICSFICMPLGQFSLVYRCGTPKPAGIANRAGALGAPGGAPGSGMIVLLILLLLLLLMMMMMIIIILVSPISLLRLSLQRLVDPTFPGSPLWT